MNKDFLWNALQAHPVCEPTDAVKLLYQNEFGVGHLLTDEVACIRRVANELAETAPDEAVPPFEPIGNGLCRLNLRNPDVRQLAPERIARMMLATATQVRGSVEAFQEKLNLLRQVIAAHDDAPFSVESLDAYLHGYAAQGYPPVSHGERYRQAYRPAYRVVKRMYGEALPALLRMEDALSREGRATLVIDGDCGAGKTTLCGLLAPLYDCNVFHMDDFFLPFSMRSPARMSEAGGNIHYERFLSDVLKPLLEGGAFCYDAYDCHRDKSTPIDAPVRPVTLIEGSYSLHPKFSDAYTRLDALRLLLSVPSEEQLRRIRLRSGEKMLERFRNEWIPLEKTYFQAYHRNRADELTLESQWHSEDAASFAKE